MLASQALRVFASAFVYIWKKKNFHHLRLYLEKNTDHADAAFARLSAVLMA